MKKKSFAPIPLKIKDNLWIKGNTIVSYETEVATIKDDTILEHGKFTRTTTKHICAIASMFSLKIKTDPNSAGVRFWKFEQGVRCDSPTTKTLSQRISNEAAQHFVACGRDLIAALSVVSQIGKKDLELIKSYHDKNGIPWRVFELQRFAHTKLHLL
jgi:hypothetical protein